MERRALPPVRGLDLDQPLPPVRIETGDIVACAVPVFFRNPADLLRQVLPPRCSQRVTLVLQDALFTGLAKGAVAFVPRGHVEFLGDVEHLLELVGRGLVGQSRCRPDPELRRLGHAINWPGRKGAVRPARVNSQPSCYSVDQAGLEVERRFVARDPDLAEPLEDSTDILVAPNSTISNAANPTTYSSSLDLL